MNTYPRWLIPVLVMGLILVVSLVASQFAQKPPCYASGTIHIEKELEGLAKNTKTLFISVHDSQSPSPMPFGALRIPVSKPPKGAFQNFYLTKDNLMVMQKGSPFPSTFRLKAKLSQDGQALSQTTELFGEIDGVNEGQEGVHIYIKNLKPAS